jgi:hypothetical protein
VNVRFGLPLWPEARPADHRTMVRELTERLMHEIAGLCGQEYMHDHRLTARATVAV